MLSYGSWTVRSSFVASKRNAPYSHWVAGGGTLSVAELSAELSLAEPVCKRILHRWEHILLFYSDEGQVQGGL